MSFQVFFGFFNKSSRQVRYKLYKFWWYLGFFVSIILVAQDQFPYEGVVSWFLIFISVLIARQTCIMNTVLFDNFLLLFKNIKNIKKIKAIYSDSHLMTLRPIKKPQIV